MKQGKPYIAPIGKLLDGQGSAADPAGELTVLPKPPAKHCPPQIPFPLRPSGLRLYGPTGLANPSTIIPHFHLPSNATWRGIEELTVTWPALALGGPA